MPGLGMTSGGSSHRTAAGQYLAWLLKRSSLHKPVRVLLSEVMHALTRLEPARRTTGVAGGKGLIAEGAAAAMSCVTCFAGVSQSVRCGLSGCSTGGVPSLS